MDRDSEEWSDLELAATVEAYATLLQKLKAGERINKADAYRKLSKRFSRGEKAFEFRMQNISAIYDELGHPWLQGLPPARNIGSSLRPRIVGLVVETLRYKETNPWPRKVSSIRTWLIRIAEERSLVRYGEVMSSFGIDRFTLMKVMGVLANESVKRGEPIITALIVSKATGHCSKGIVEEFGVNDDSAERTRLYDFWSVQPLEVSELSHDVENIEVKAAKFVSAAARPEQGAFRRKVFLACDGKCVVTGCKVVQALDAAHRRGRSWRSGHNSASDGIVLRRDLHALYDSGLLLIGRDGTVTLGSSAASHYTELEGALVPQHIARYFR